LLVFKKFMAHNLSEEKLMEYRVAFEFFDKDSDGQINTNELNTIMKSLGQNVNEKQLEEIIQEIDADGSGSMDFNEFIFLIIKKMKDLDLEEEMKEAFKVFDKDGNKVLTSHEMRQIFMNMKGIPESEIEMMIKEADLDGDGQIDYEEFLRMMSSK
jgi:calmodulin